MQGSEVTETPSLDDDMVDGDLGDGLRSGSKPSSNSKKSPSCSGLTPAEFQVGGALWIPGRASSDGQCGLSWKLPRPQNVQAPLVDLSKDELKEKLQEAAETINVLCCELEAAHRYLEGKYEALKILQGKTILDKATCHTQSLLQKTEERSRALEKEVNSLQWELSVIQIQMKESEQSWKHKFKRILSDNETLTENLKERQMEQQRLRAENSALRQQCVELLSMLNVKEQLVYEETKPQQSPDREAGVLQLAVLGACRCVGVAEVCPCGWTAAASRKQLVQLQQELNSVRLRREEALMVADAFRIAFEQQLRTRSEHLMLLAKAKVLKSSQCKPEGSNRRSLMSVGERLRGLLPSALDLNSPEDLLLTLDYLLDLLNDKEEALAHQRKVSFMLAHSADQLQKRLHGHSEQHLEDTSEETGPLERHPEDTSEETSPPEQHSEHTSKKTSPLERHSEDMSEETSPLERHSEDMSEETSPLERHSEDTSKKTSPQQRHSEDTSEETCPLERHSEDTSEETCPLERHPEDTSEETSPLERHPEDTSEETCPLERHPEDTSEETSPLERHPEDTSEETSPLERHPEDTSEETSPLERHPEDTSEETSPLERHPEDTSEETSPLEQHREDNSEESYPPV